MPLTVKAYLYLQCYNFINTTHCYGLRKFPKDQCSSWSSSFVQYVGKLDMSLKAELIPNLCQPLPVSSKRLIPSLRLIVYNKLLHIITVICAVILVVSHCSLFASRQDTIYSKQSLHASNCVSAFRVAALFTTAISLNWKCWYAVQ